MGFQSSMFIGLEGKYGGGVVLSSLFFFINGCFSRRKHTATQYTYTYIDEC